MIDRKVLTIILNYRTPELTIKAMKAAFREMSAIQGEILVIDNDSGDDSAEIISKAIVQGGYDLDHRVRFARSPVNGGYGAGNNFGMSIGLSDGSQPDFYYILNSDAFAQRGAIKNLLSFMMENRRAGIAGSATKGGDGTPHQTAFRFPTIAGEFEGAVRTGIITKLLRKYVVPLPVLQTTETVDWVAGSSIMVRRQMLDEIGSFDETYFLYFEETDLSLRASKAGWTTHFVASSEIVHEGSSSTGMKFWSRTPEYWFDSRRHYFTKNHGRVYAACATLARIIGTLLWRIRVVLNGKPMWDPPHFLKDLVKHSVQKWPRPEFARSKAKPGKPTQDPITEDQR